MKSRSLLMTFLMVLCLLSFGCFRMNTDVEIHEDGSADVRLLFMSVNLLNEELEKLKDEIVRKDPDAYVETINDGNMSGYKISTHYPNMDAFGKRSGNIFAARPGICDGIQQQNRWFFNAYSFDLYIANEKSTPKKPQSEFDTKMMEAFLSQVQADFKLSLPEKAETTNADSITNDGKLLQWDLKGPLLNDKPRHIRATFRIWNKTNTVLTIVALVVLLVAALIAMRTALKKPEDDNNRFVLPGVLLLAFLICSVASAYYYFAPVTFTNKDIISNKLEKTAEDNKPRSSQNAALKGFIFAAKDSNYEYYIDPNQMLRYPPHLFVSVKRVKNGQIEDTAVIDFTSDEGKRFYSSQKMGRDQVANNAVVSSIWKEVSANKDRWQMTNTLPQGMAEAAGLTNLNSSNNQRSNATESAANAAIQTFKQFHENITNRNYNNAYGLMSKSMRNSFSYDNWKKGYKTTVQSIPQDISVAQASSDHVTLTYVLKAVDNPGGTRYFNGKVQLIKTPDGWRINEIVNN